MTVYKLNFETSVFNMSAATGYWSTSLVATWQCITTERERERAPGICWSSRWLVARQSAEAPAVHQSTVSAADPSPLPAGSDHSPTAGQPSASALKRASSDKFTQRTATSVSVSVCLSTHVSQESHVQTLLKFPVHASNMAMPRTSFSGFTCSAVCVHMH